MGKGEWGKAAAGPLGLVVTNTQVLRQLPLGCVDRSLESSKMWQMIWKDKDKSILIKKNNSPSRKVRRHTGSQVLDTRKGVSLPWTHDGYNLRSFHDKKLRASYGSISWPAGEDHVTALQCNQDQTQVEFSRLLFGLCSASLGAFHVTLPGKASSNTWC